MPIDRSSRHDGDDGSREVEQGREQEGWVGVGIREVEEAVIVPWEEWGPRAARVISPPSFHWITAHAGQRWLSLEDDKLVIRDFSTARVLRARASAGAAAHTSGSPAHLRYNNSNNDNNKNEDVGSEKNGNGTAPPVLAPAQTRIHGHGRSQVQDFGSNATCFGEDVVSELPFIETRVDARGRAGDMVLTDGGRLISFVRMGQPPTFQPPTFEIYVLEDDDEDDDQKQEVGVQVEPEEGSHGAAASPLTRSPTPGAATNLNLERVAETELG